MKKVITPDFFKERIYEINKDLQLTQIKIEETELNHNLSYASRHRRLRIYKTRVDVLVNSKESNIEMFRGLFTGQRHIDFIF